MSEKKELDSILNESLFKNHLTRFGLITELIESFNWDEDKATQVLTVFFHKIEKLYNKHKDNKISKQEFTNELFNSLKKKINEQQFEILLKLLDCHIENYNLAKKEIN